MFGHFIHRYDLRVVGYGVNFFKTAKSAGNLFYAGPPIQGGFAHIVSGDIESGFFQLWLLGGSRSEQGKYCQANERQYHEVRIHRISP